MPEESKWVPRREAGLQRMTAFAVRAGRSYAAGRNFDFGPDNRGNVSLMSPYLRRRLVLEEELLAATLARHSADAADKFVQEIFWRAYFKGWLEHRPSVWADYRLGVRNLIDALTSDSELNARYESATGGLTGIDCFDAWAAELIRTGYLHNHARMWFASIWIFTLRLPWQLGADFFYRHLLDGDPASNTLSWRWVGGLHTRGKTYLAQASNIARYTDNRYNPEGQLAGTAPPLSEPAEHPVQPLPDAHPALPATPYGLLITEEDCYPESLSPDLSPACVLGATAPARRSPLETAPLAAEFARDALRDALQRAQQAFELPAEESADDDWGRMLVDWARRQDIRTIVTAYAPAGPVAEQLALARETLRSCDIALVQVRRHYDALTWPHATRGFFRLKARIPRCLEALGAIRQAGEPQ